MHHTLRTLAICQCLTKGSLNISTFNYTFSCNQFPKVLNGIRNGSQIVKITETLLSLVSIEVPLKEPVSPARSPNQNSTFPETFPDALP